MLHKTKTRKTSEKYEQLVKFDITNSNLQCFFKRLKPNHYNQLSKTFKSKEKINNNRQIYEKYGLQKSVSKSDNRINNKIINNATQNLKNKFQNNIVKSKSPDLATQVMNKVLTQIQANGINFNDDEDSKIQQNLEQANELSQKIWSSNYLISANKSFSTSGTNISETTLYNNNYNYQYYFNQQMPLFDQSFFFVDNTQQYYKNIFQIDQKEILKDGRTTVMIKNIPNKYTLKFLTDQIDQKHQNRYDFLYLPFDFNNNCNIGYAFINFIDGQALKIFYLQFNNKKWLKFRSQKICILAYARLQGRNSLIQHFYNSKVLNQKDKRFRPVIKEVHNMQKITNLLNKQRKQSKKKEQN